MDTTLEFGRSRKKQAGLLLLTLCLVAAGFFTIIHADDVVDRIFGWFGVFFFGAAAVIALRNTIRGGVVFSMSLSGLSVSDAGIGFIPWSEVATCNVVTIKGN